MHRFYLPSTAISGNRVSITGEAAGRIGRVLRLRPDTLVSVFDGSGREWDVRLKLFSASEVTGEVVAVRDEEGGGLKVYIGQGLPKSLKMDMIIQKATELGVHSVTPLKMERSIVKIDGRGVVGKVSRWEKIAVEASEQCGRTTLPLISPPMNLGEFCELVEDADLKILLWERESENLLKSFFKKNTSTPLKVAVVIGPEGGVDEKEVGVFKKAGFNTVGLGGYVLRTETVALSILSIIQFYYGPMGGKNG